MLATVVICLLHQEETEDEADRAEDSAPVKHPLPTLSICNESCDYRCEEVGSCEQQSVQSNVSTTLVSEVYISNRYLAKGFDRSSKKALQDLACNPLAVGFGVRHPYHNSHGGEERKQVHWSFAKLKRQRLPE